MDEREIEIGDLVTVATAGPQIDGIVFDLPRGAKAVVAVIDRTRGPGAALRRRATRSATRERPGADDPGAARADPPHAGAGPVRARRQPAAAARRAAGFRRSATHRTTGR